MSLTLKKIELCNIRSHKHVVLEPSEDGVTAISGPNGSGKSTIVDSVAWVLYGTKPHGVSKVISILRSGADLTSDKAYARVWLRLDRSDLKVERRFVNKHGSVECEVWEKRDGESDYKQIAGPAVSHAEPFIRKKLKMDEKGFLAAILVQQKQVDQLISASPRERAEVIERMTGISSITEALVEARQHYNGLRKALKVTSVDETELEKLKKEHKELSAKFTRIKKRRDRAKSELSALEVAVQDLESKVEAEEAVEEEVNTLKEEMMKAEANISSLEQNLERITKLKTAKKEQLSKLGRSGDIKTIQDKLSELKKDLRSKQRESDNLTRDLEDAGRQKEKYEAILAKSPITELDEAKEGLSKLEKKLEETRAKLDSISGEKRTLQSDIKKIKSAVGVITSSDGTCPTCLQHVEDPDSAVGSLHEEQHGLEESLVKLDKTKSTLEASLPTLENKISSFTKVIESISNIKEVTELIEKTTKQRTQVDSELSVLEGETKKVEKLYDSARRVSDMQEEYDSLHNSALEISDSIENNKKFKNEVSEALKKKQKASGGSLASLRKKLASKSAQRNEGIIKYGEAREQASLLEAQIEFSEERITNSEEVLRQYQELMEATEVAGSSAETIEEFRENRIKTSVPIVATYASDLLNRFTEGKFTQFKLDQKFNATVTLNSGVERPVGLLSGGELSAAALSLRLAISMLLNSGSSRNMIILDEVLVSQDAARAEQILSTVKEVCRGQVLMISHGPYTNEIADKVVEL